MINLISSIKPRIFILITIFISIFPFLNTRVVRMAGDEKVYVSQAIEMSRSGSWFTQTLAGEPNYFKGPVHYILVKIGMMIFGNNLIAGVWMNLLFALGTAILMYNLGKKYFDQNKAMLLAFASGLNVGLFSHALASQMEVELIFFYTLVIYFLDKTEIKLENLSAKDVFKSDVKLWIAIGLCGWIKSPAHCVLLGASALLYWFWTNSLWTRLKNKGFYIAIVTGVLVCGLGYLPVILLDYENFHNTYMLRENMTKGGNNRHWSYVVEPLLHFALPWTIIILAGIFKFFKNKNNNLIRLGLSLSIPTILFWMSWQYKGQNYNLPTMSALLLFAFASFEKDIPRFCYQIVGALGVIAVILGFAILFRFMPLPTWWNLSTFILSLTFLLSFSALFLFFSEVRLIMIGTVFFFIGIGLFVTPIGEREMIGIKDFLKSNPKVVLHYDDIDTSIWNEWGLLQLTTGHEIYGVHKPEQLQNVFKAGHAIILQNKEALDRTQKAFEEFKKAIPPTESSMPTANIIEWPRFLTKGKSSNGRNMFKEAWNTRDLTKVERSFYIFSVQ